MMMPRAVLRREDTESVFGWGRSVKRPHDRVLCGGQRR